VINMVVGSKEGSSRTEGDANLSNLRPVWAGSNTAGMSAICPKTENCPRVVSTAPFDEVAQHACALP